MNNEKSYVIFLIKVTVVTVEIETFIYKFTLFSSEHRIKYSSMLFFLYRNFRDSSTVTTVTTCNLLDLLGF